MVSQNAILTTISHHMMTTEDLTARASTVSPILNLSLFQHLSSLVQHIWLRKANHLPQSQQPLPIRNCNPPVISLVQPRQHMFPRRRRLSLQLSCSTEFFGPRLDLTCCEAEHAACSHFSNLNMSESLFITEHNTRRSDLGHVAVFATAMAKGERVPNSSGVYCSEWRRMLKELRRKGCQIAIKHTEP